jgi:hypothetical protein
MRLKKLALRFFDAIAPARHLTVVQGDSLPDSLPFRSLVLARDDDEDWCVGMRCPCGCGRKIELLVIREAKPRWDLIVDAVGRPTLTPSVWLRDGCKSHFWIRKGTVRWCG